MIYIKDFDCFINEAHHMLSGDNSLSELAHDLSEFVQWQMSHSINKKKEYDAKKYIYYYRWDYNEIIEWFVKNEKKFHFPVFLIENQSTISVKISLARMVKGRKKEHETMDLIHLKGNERASHATKKLKDSETGKNHVIYLNTYYLAKEKNIDVRKFIMSDDFEKELTGTVRHEFMHAFDSYKISGVKRDNIDLMKKLYKKYRSTNNIGKEWVTFKNIGSWSENKFNADFDMLSEENNLRTFLYMLLYYMTDTEMNAYIQTFYNQVINSDGKDRYDSDIYKRYKVIQTVLEHDFDSKIIKNTINKKFIKDISSVIKIKSDDPVKVYETYKNIVLKKLDKYFVKLHKIFFDIKESLKTTKK